MTPPPPAARPLRLVRLVRLVRPATPVPYPEALALQHRLLAQRVALTGDDTLVVLEHPPTITLGRHADPAGVLAPAAELRAAGVEVVRVERGGQATYHGPGQWVGYPILRLAPRGLGVRRYVAALEEVLLRTCFRFGVAAERQAGRPGVFTAAGKIGAVGVAVRRGVSFHGFALNVCPDLSHFRWIIPCGLADVPPTSLEQLLGTAPEMERVAAALVEEFRAVFDPPQTR